MHCYPMTVGNEPLKIKNRRGGTADKIHTDMEMIDFYKELNWKKIEIRWNNNPIEMKKFTSFLTIELERSKDHLGSCNGWTKLVSEEHQLYISGGFVNGVEYLDGLQYKRNLDNVWNDYVNPFFLFDIMTTEGKKFFLDYYKDEIKEVFDKQKQKIKTLNSKLKEARNKRSGLAKCLTELENSAL